MRFIIHKKGFFADHRDKPIIQIIKSVRDQIATLRGQLSDIGREYRGLSERLEPSEGGLTLVLADLYTVMQELARIEKRPFEEFYGPSGEAK